MKIKLTGFAGPWGQVPTLATELHKRGMLATDSSEADWVYCHDPQALLDVKYNTAILQGKTKVVAKVLDMNWAAEAEDARAKEHMWRLDLADCVLVNTEFVGKQIRELGYEGAYHVVGDPVNVNLTVASAIAGKIPRGTADFFSYGRLEDEAKRFRLAEETVRTLNTIYDKSFTYMVAGPAIKPGKYGCARGLGFLNSMSLTNILCASKCVLAPSVREGLGLIPIEAVLCGAVPVVAATSVMQEVWGDTIPMFEPDNIEDFVSVVEALIQSHFEWDLGPASKIAATYTPERVVNRIVAALEN